MLSDDGSTRSRGEPHREPRERAMKRRTGGGREQETGKAIDGMRQSCVTDEGRGFTKHAARKRQTE